jgi:hypothetical protein
MLIFEGSPVIKFVDTVQCTPQMKRNYLCVANKMQCGGSFATRDCKSGALRFIPCGRVGDGLLCFVLFILNKGLRNLGKVNRKGMQRHKMAGYPRSPSRFLAERS